MSIEPFVPCYGFIQCCAFEPNVTDYMTAAIGGCHIGWNFRDALQGIVRGRSYSRALV